MHPEAESSLLEEGLRSYVPASSAILAFRELVQSRCRQVVEKRLAEYKAALGVPLDKGQLLNYQTRTSEWDGTYATLGLEMRNLGAARAWLYHVLHWELGEDESWLTEVGITIWVRKRYQIAQLRKAFQPHPPNLTFSEVDKETWLYEPLTAAEVGRFENKLDEVVGQSIKLWKRAGGLHVLSADLSSED